VNNVFVIISPGYPFSIRLKVKVTGSQSAKHIEGDRVAGVSLHSIECQFLVGNNFLFCNRDRSHT